MTATQQDRQDTSALEKALKLRSRVKRKKPEFARQESWRYKRIKESWRKPRGIDNKMRRKIKGWPPTVSVGYRGPKVARGIHPSGYKEVLVHNLEELKKIDPRNHGIRIAHAVGKRKRAKILLEARRRKIRILNFKEAKEEVRGEEIEEEESKEGEEEKKVEAEKKTEEKPGRRSRQKKAKSAKGGQKSNGRA